MCTGSASAPVQWTWWRPAIASRYASLLYHGARGYPSFLADLLRDVSFLHRLLSVGLFDDVLRAAGLLKTTCKPAAFAMSMVEEFLQRFAGAMRRPGLKFPVLCQSTNEPAS